MIRDVGGFLPQDDEGWLVNPAEASALQDAWRPALEATSSACRSEAGSAFHSFYVRGSVACGAAVEGSSDLDTVLVVDDAQGERRPPWQHALAERVLATSPFVTGLEVVVLGRGALLAAAADLPLAPPVLAEWCFLLALGGRCLAGTDLLPALGRFRPGPEVAYVLRGLPSALLTFHTRVAELRRSAPTPETDAARRRLGPWTCKRFLRSGAELAMLSEGRYTRDLAPAARQLAACLPAFAETAPRLLAWAIEAPEDLSGLERVAQALGPALTDAARRAGLVLDAPTLLDL